MWLKVCHQKGIIDVEEHQKRKEKTWKMQLTVKMWNIKKINYREKGIIISDINKNFKNSNKNFKKQKKI